MRARFGHRTARRTGAGVLIVVLLVSCVRSPDDRRGVQRSGCYRLSVAGEAEGSRWASRFPMVLELTAMPADSAAGEPTEGRALRAYTWENARRTTYPFGVWTPVGAGDSLVAGPENAYAGIRLRARRQDAHVTGRVLPFSDVVAPGDTAGGEDRAFAVRGEKVSCPPSGE